MFLAMSLQEIWNWVSGARKPHTTHHLDIPSPDASEEFPFLSTDDEWPDSTNTSDDDSEYSLCSESSEIDDEIMEHAMDDAEERALEQERLAAEMEVFREDMPARIRHVQKHSFSSDTTSSSNQFDQPTVDYGMDLYDKGVNSTSSSNAVSGPSGRHLPVLRWLLLL